MQYCLFKKEKQKPKENYNKLINTYMKHCLTDI